MVQTNRPTVWGGPGLELYYGLGGGIFIAEVTSINPFTTHSARQSGAAAAAALCSAPALSLPLLLSPSAGQAFLPPLPCDFFFFSTLGDRAFTCCTAPFPGHPSSHPHSHLTIKQFQILDWSPLYLLGCYLVPSIRSRPSTLDPRGLVTPSIKSRCCPPGHANPSDHPSFKIPTNLTRVALSFDGTRRILGAASQLRLALDLSYLVTPTRKEPFITSIISICWLRKPQLVKFPAR